MTNEKPFVKQHLDEEKEKNNSVIFSTRLNDADLLWFQPAKKFIKQPKNSTALKQLAEIGAIVVIHDEKMHKILDVLRNNFRRNRRMGIAESEYEIRNL